MDVLAIFMAAAWLFLLAECSADTVEELVNTCLDGRHHKKKPGAESELYDHCSPWAKRSCCTKDNSRKMQIDRSWLNFNWHHCGQMSPQCTQHFIKDLCFYQCSPNVGPFLTPDKRKIRNNRYMNVPMCQSTCNRWWHDCKMDMTCTDNWLRNFNWTSGENKCPVGSKCRTYQEVFGNANSFCEKVWDNGFKVVPDKQDCFRLWFSADENPNEAVARREAARLLGLPASSSSRFIPSVFSAAVILLRQFAV